MARVSLSRYEESATIRERTEAHASHCQRRVAIRYVFTFLSRIEVERRENACGGLDILWNWVQRANSFLHLLSDGQLFCRFESKVIKMSLRGGWSTRAEISIRTSKHGLNIGVLTTHVSSIKKFICLLLWSSLIDTKRVVKFENQAVHSRGRINV